VQDGITHEEYRKTLGKLPLSGDQESRLYSDMVGRIDAKYQKEVDKSKSQETSGGENQKTNAKTRAKKTSSFDVDKSLEEQLQDMNKDIELAISSYNTDFLENLSDDFAYIYTFYFDQIIEEEIKQATICFWDGHSAGENQALMAGYEVYSPDTTIHSFLSAIGFHIRKQLGDSKKELRSSIESYCEISKTKEELLDHISNAIEITKNKLNSKLEEIYADSNNYGVLCVAYSNSIDKLLINDTIENIHYNENTIPSFPLNYDEKTSIQIV
jgi:hypothetical protein